MLSTQQSKPKSRIEAEVVLTDGGTLHGNLFVGQQQRLLDVLNDDRAFLPMELAENSIIIINKATIARIIPIKEAASRIAEAPRWLGS